jgi:hypothetical protein
VDETVADMLGSLGWGIDGSLRAGTAIGYD